MFLSIPGTQLALLSSNKLTLVKWSVACPGNTVCTCTQCTSSSLSRPQGQEGRESYESFPWREMTGVRREPECQEQVQRMEPQGTAEGDEQGENCKRESGQKLGDQLSS